MSSSLLNKIAAGTSLTLNIHVIKYVVRKLLRTKNTRVVLSDRVW